MTVEEAINQRRSVRKFNKEPLNHEEMTLLLRAAQKVPSAGGIRALIAFPITAEETRKKLFWASRNQLAILNAPMCVVIACDFERIKDRYGKRAARYGYMEAGHMGQNIALQAVSMGLGSVMIGAFHDNEVKEALGMKEDPLYIIPVGRCNG